MSKALAAMRTVLVLITVAVAGAWLYAQQPVTLVQPGGTAVPLASGGNGAVDSNTTRITGATGTSFDACADISQVVGMPISTATSGNVQLVAISGSTLVYVCGFDVTSIADVSVQFVSGTGSACATGETDKTGTYNLSAASGAGIRGIARTNGGAPQFKSAAGEAVCIELSGSVQVDGTLTYVQR